MTGTARVVQEAKEEAEALLRQQDGARRRREIARRRGLIERQIADLTASLAAEEDEEHILAVEDVQREDVMKDERQSIAVRRGAAE